MTAWRLDQDYRFRGQVVRYLVTGAGPALVFVHGTPFSSYVWHRVIPHFVDSHRVHCFDLLGYGQSEQREGQDVSLGVQNELLAELLDHWALGRPDVVAHDFGGATALRTHLLNGKDYRSLTLIDPVALAPWGSPFVEHVRQHEAALRGVPAYIHEAIVGAYVRGAVRRAIPEEELAPYVRSWLGEIGQATTEARFLSPWVSYLPASSTVPSPRAFLHRIAGAPGELVDSSTAYAYSRALAASSPRVRLFTIGRSEEGRDIVLLAIADEDGIPQLDR